MDIDNQFFVGNPFLSFYSAGYFSADPHLGHSFFAHSLVGSTRFCDLPALVRVCRREKKPVIVFLGDSSVSGWNSENVFPNDLGGRSPFFTYRTFADFVREFYHCHVINAGVPGYSIFQGRRYAARILEVLSSASVKVDVAVLYFGNNDATFAEVGDAVRFKEGTREPGEVSRVSVDDFRANTEALADMCRNHGAKVVVVVPPRNFGWPPGLRSKRFPKEFDMALAGLQNPQVRRAVISATEYYLTGKFDDALECDVVLPRIKQRYIDALLTAAQHCTLQVVNLPERFLSDDSFLDYCHPAPVLNKRIALNIGKLCGLAVKEGDYKDDEPRCRVLNVLMLARLYYRGIRFSLVKKLIRSESLHESHGKIYPFH